MEHRKKGRKLKRTASHKKALLSNLSCSLIKYKRIKTTVAKAKELRSYVEPIINKAKIAFLAKEKKPEVFVHQAREIRKFLKNREAINILLGEVAPKVVERNGGYTRVLKVGFRYGDGADEAIIELVDFGIVGEKQKDEKTPKAQKSQTKLKSSAKKTKTTESGKEKKESSQKTNDVKSTVKDDEKKSGKETKKTKTSTENIKSKDK